MTQRGGVEERKMFHSQIHSSNLLHISSGQDHGQEPGTPFGLQASDKDSGTRATTFASWAY